jgi:hypothetical protein
MKYLLALGLLLTLVFAVEERGAVVPPKITLLARKAPAPTSVPLDDFFLGTDLQ